MNIRTSLGKYACAAVALLVIMGGADAVRGQQVSQATPPPGAATSSTEEGHTQMDESFDSAVAH